MIFEGNMENKREFDEVQNVTRIDAFVESLEKKVGVRIENH